MSLSYEQKVDRLWKIHETPRKSRGDQNMTTTPVTEPVHLPRQESLRPERSRTLASLAAVSICGSPTASALHNILTPTSIPKRGLSKDQNSWRPSSNTISTFEEDSNSSVQNSSSLSVDLDSLATMPNGTNFSARARAAELNAARATRAGRRIEETQVQEADEVPEIAPLSLGELKFVRKRVRGRTGREDLPHNNSTDRLQSETTARDNNGAYSVQMSHKNLSTGVATSSYPSLNPAVKPHAMKDYGAPEHLGTSSIEKITQAHPTSLQNSAGSSESAHLLHGPSQSSLTTITRPVGGLDQSNQEMARKREGGYETSGHGKNRNQNYETQNLQAYTAGNASFPFYRTVGSNEGMLPYSDDVRNSPYYHQVQQTASPRHETHDPRSYNAYSYGSHAPNVYHNLAQPYSMPAQVSQLHGPNQFLVRQIANTNYGGIENQSPKVLRSASAVPNQAATGPSYLSGFKASSNRSGEDPFMDNPISSSRQANTGRYQASSNFSNLSHGRSLPPAVKGTRADHVRSERVQPYQSSGGITHDQFDLYRQVHSLYGQSEAKRPESSTSNNILYDNTTDVGENADAYLSDRQPNFNVVPESAMTHKSRMNPNDKVNSETYFENEDSSVALSSTVPAAANPLYHHDNKSTTANAVPDFDPYTLKESDPLPLAGQWIETFPHIHRAGSEMTGFSDKQQQPGIESQQTPVMWYDRINTDLQKMQEHMESHTNPSQRQFRPDVDVFYNEVPLEHQEVRKILLRQAGYESLPTNNANPKRQLYTGSEPLGTPSDRESKHAPIGSERRRSSVHNDSITNVPISKEETDARAAIGIFAPVIANLHSYAAGNNRDYFSRYGQPPAWAIDHSPEGNKSLFGGEWGNPPQRVARDPRYLGQGTMHEGRMTYFEDLSKHGPFGAGASSRGVGLGRGRGR